MRHLVIGCGYLGRRVAKAWVRRGDDVWALTRDPDRGNEFEREGIRAIVGDVMEPRTLKLPEVDVVLYAVGYDRSSVASKREIYVEGLRNALSALPSAGQMIYISSTSVYGQTTGEWVDERSPCRPVTVGGRICLEAEQLIRTHSRGAGVVNVLRLAGIYGPGRLAARVEALRRQEPIASHPDGWLNLIHVDDAASVIQTCAESACAIESLIVCDDRPLQRRVYYERLTKAIDAPAPKFAPSDVNDLGKRCSNRLLKDSVMPRLAFPSVFDGLSSAIAPDAES